MDYSDATGLIAGSLPISRGDAPFHLLYLRGPDAGDYLQRMCSQDALGMAAGECRPAAFLNGKGKLLHTCLVGRLVDGFALALPGPQAEDLREYLERFHFAEQMEFSSPGWACVEEFRQGPEEQGVEDQAAAGLRMWFSRRGLIQELRFAATHEAAAAGDPQHFELLRILRGDPQVGGDTEASTLGLEAAIDDHFHFDKGCYTGQEIVARIRTYGHTNRGLCLLHVAGNGSIEAGAAIVECEDGDAVGRVMSSADLPAAGGRLALGILPNALADGSEALALGEKGGPELRVIPWPDQG